MTSQKITVFTVEFTQDSSMKTTMTTRTTTGYWLL